MRISKSQLTNGAWKPITNLGTSGKKAMTSAEREQLFGDLGGMKVIRRKWGIGPKRTKRVYGKKPPRKIGTPAIEKPEWAYLRSGRSRGAQAPVAQRATDASGVDLKLVKTPSSTGFKGGGPAHTDRYGGRKNGKSVVTIGSDAISMPQAQRDGLLRHELAHAQPRRSAARMSQIVATPKHSNGRPTKKSRDKLAREEARADSANDGYSGVATYEDAIKRGEFPFDTKRANNVYMSQRRKMQRIHGVKRPSREIALRTPREMQ